MQYFTILVNLSEVAIIVIQTYRALESAGGANALTSMLVFVAGCALNAAGTRTRLSAYREQLISLFWEQDLPLRKVQEIMKEEHGLNFRSAFTS